MPELLIATIMTTVLGVFAYARIQAIRTAYELFRDTLGGFFGDRGAYENYESFLKVYKSDIESEGSGHNKGVIHAWVRFLDAIRIARNDSGKRKFEGSEKALDKLCEDLRLAFPYMSRWQYVSPMVLVAIGVLGSCFVLLLAALQIAQWQVALVYVSLLICVGVAGMLGLRIYEQYTLERVNRRIRVVANHLKRHLIMRTEKDYLLETGRAIQDELEAFKDITSLLNLRVKRLADDQLSKDDIKDAAKADLTPLVQHLDQFNAQLNHHLRDNKLIQNQQAAKLQDTLIEFFDQDRSSIQVGIDTTKKVESLLLTLGQNLGRNLAGQDMLMNDLRRKLDQIMSTKPGDTSAVEQKFAEVSEKLSAQLSAIQEGMTTAKREETKPTLAVVQTSTEAPSEKQVAVPSGIYEVVRGVRHLLGSAEKSCVMVSEQKRYLELTIKRIDEMADRQVDRFSSCAPEFVEDLQKALRPLEQWKQHISKFKPVTGRVARLTGEKIDSLLEKMETEDIKAEFKHLWLNADELKDLMIAGESLNANLTETVKATMKLQDTLLKARETLLFLETVDRKDVETSGRELVNYLQKQLLSSLRRRKSVRFSVNDYARAFVPKVRAIETIVDESGGLFVAPKKPEPKAATFKVEYTKAS